MIVRRRSDDPFRTPGWFIALFAGALVVMLGFLGLIAWALIEVVKWLTSN